MGDRQDVYALENKPLKINPPFQSPPNCRDAIRRSSLNISTATNGGEALADRLGSETRWKQTSIVRGGLGPGGGREDLLPNLLQHILAAVPIGDKDEALFRVFAMAWVITQSLVARASGCFI